MTVSPGQTRASESAATEVVTLADGQRVAFGLNADGTYTPPRGTYFHGAMSDVATWVRPLTAAEVSGLYTAGTSPAALLTKTTRPSGRICGQQAYNPVTSDVTSVTDANGGSWTVGESPRVWWRLPFNGRV